MNVFAVIPTYNEKRTIGSLVNELLKRKIRVVVVDDGSKDGTIIDANKFGAELIVHSKNAGKGRCLREGLEYSLEKGCDIAITIDGDGQHNLNDIGRFIDEYRRSQADIIIGNRMYDTKKMPFIRKITNLVMSFIISGVIGQKIEDTQCGYRLVSKNAIERMKLKTFKYEIESEMLIEAKRQGLKISSVKIDSIYQEELSKINPFLDTVRFIKFIIYESLRRKS